jgi:hypothetical protein
MDDGTTTDVTATTDEIEGQPAHRISVWLLIILGTVVMVLSTLNAWVERQLLDTRLLGEREHAAARQRRRA